jgi:transposase
MAHVRVLGIDLAKQICQIVGMDDTGPVVWRKRCPRAALRSVIAQLPPVVSGMAAGGGAHDWARRCRRPGPTVKVLAPQGVKPPVKAHRHAMAEAEALGEAVTRPTRRFVPLKAMAPPDLQAPHRGRERRINAPTALMHETRGWRSESGSVRPQGGTTLRHGLCPMLEPAQAQRTARGRTLSRQLAEAWRALEERLAYDTEPRDTMGQAQPVCPRLRTMPGIGPLPATALVAAVSDATHGKSGRRLAAWLGLVPRQHAAGGQPRLLGSSTRGDRERRQPLGHGARATLRWATLKPDRRSQWGRALSERRGTNRAVVAPANQTARSAWVLLPTEQVSTPEHSAA